MQNLIILYNYLELLNLGKLVDEYEELLLYTPQKRFLIDLCLVLQFRERCYHYILVPVICHHINEFLVKLLFIVLAIWVSLSLENEWLVGEVVVFEILTAVYWVMYFVNQFVNDVDIKRVFKVVKVRIFENVIYQCLQRNQFEELLADFLKARLDQKSDQYSLHLDHFRLIKKTFQLEVFLIITFVRTI